MQPYLSVRPTPTKYALFPIINLRKDSNVNFVEYPPFNGEQIFNPGDKSPWSEYASNINISSELTNRYNRVDKCGLNDYIPDSKSSLYHISVDKGGFEDKNKIIMPPKTFYEWKTNESIFMNNTRINRE